MFKGVKQFSSPHTLATFCLWVLLIDTEKQRLRVRKVTDFNLLVGDVSVFDSRKFEMVTLKYTDVYKNVSVNFDTLYYQA